MKNFEQLLSEELKMVRGGEDHIEQFCYDGCGCGEPEPEKKKEPVKTPGTPIYE